VSRLQKLRHSLAQKELDVLVVSQTENRRYLSGFTGSAGWLIVSQNSAYLAVDFRYIEQAKKESPDFEIIHVKGDMFGWFLKFLSELGLKKTGFEADHISFAASQNPRVCFSLLDRLFDSSWRGVGRRSKSPCAIHQGADSDSLSDGMICHIHTTFLGHERISCSLVVTKLEKRLITTCKIFQKIFHELTLIRT
jgi:hypothetical protein